MSYGLRAVDLIPSLSVNGLILMEIPQLTIEWDGDNPTKAMCSVCRAIFPTIEGKGAEANRRLVERAFEAHVKLPAKNNTSEWRQPRL